MADKKLRFAVISKFKKVASDSGKHIQPINIYSQQWAADAMIESYGYDHTLNAVEHYVSTSASPDWNWFAYNSDKVVQSIADHEYDKELRARLREGAKKWLED